MDLRRLGLFLAVVDHGGFTAAAKAVHVAQPAISLAVRELEAELGAALLVRSRTGAVLTSAGRALVEPARAAVRDVRTAAAAVAAVTGLVAGRLDLVSLPTLVAAPLAELVGRFRLDCPAVTVGVAGAADPVELADMVRSGRAEAGITEAGSAIAALEVIPIGQQELVAISPPPSPLDWCRSGRREGYLLGCGLRMDVRLGAVHNAPAGRASEPCTTCHFS